MRIASHTLFVLLGQITKENVMFLLIWLCGVFFFLFSFETYNIAEVFSVKYFSLRHAFDLLYDHMPAAEKPPHSLMMLPPPGFTEGMMVRFWCCSVQDLYKTFNLV